MFDKSFHGDDALVEERLHLAQSRAFNQPITGFISQALILGGFVFGFIHGHVLKDRRALFKDGGFFRTKMITGIDRDGDFWIVQTLDGYYCLLTTQKHDGEASIRRLLELFKPVPFVRRTAR